ncbi:MAG: efflux RND transporter permease subunit, partial [Oscillospiraceae bacterium]|nr:efflux RND transporter permease subunit [Oscillospiraceae bacterium]
ALALPAGVARGTGMLDTTTDQEVKHITQALLSAIFLVFLVMAIQFDSARLSIMVMMCIPLSLIGSIGLVFLTGRPMSLMALMGFLMLVGIVVNNGIYLVDGANQLRQTMPLEEALIQAGTTRLRPILMTTLTTVISMVPMLFSTNSGMGMMRDMGYIIIGGLIVSTILAMFLMPAFYLLIRGERVDGAKRGPRQHKRAAVLSASTSKG